MEVPTAPKSSAATSPGRSRRWWLASAGAVLRRPGLWWVAVVQVLRLARPGWWHRRPFLPIPDPDYLAFRLETMYGSGGDPGSGDVVTYLRWCREYRHLT